MGTLLDDTEPAPPLDFSDIEKKYTTELGGSALDGSRFSSRKLGVTLMLIEVGGFSTSAAQASALIERVRADMHALGGSDRYAPGMRVGFTGDVAISAEETAALMEDLTISSVLVVVTVLLAIMLFYGWRRSIPALFLPLAVGAVYAFALASLPPFGITELNSNTAFMGSIIVGNGINFGIIQLARYVEARRQGERSRTRSRCRCGRRARGRCPRRWPPASPTHRWSRCSSAASASSASSAGWACCSPGARPIC